MRAHRCVPAAWAAGDGPDRSAVALGEFDPRDLARGLLLTVPGEVLFATGSHKVQTAAYAMLERVGELLTREPERAAVIIGHSDALGDRDENWRLSQRRAHTVRAFLLDRFEIDPARLSVEARGEDDPIARDDTPEGRLANRRIEVLVLN